MIQPQIEAKLNHSFAPVHLDVLNESYMHNVPEGSESHFKVVVVSAQFEGQRLITRHRAVNQCLADELANHIHALAIHTYTELEWQQQLNAPVSPKCHGGSTLDK
ncbi:BolA/IbaG family iron-sulfur metabolism protein [Photobacterium carnosum]|jgi:BolA protein|uniref:DNA-binding transcriptional regulator BolA n=1 Tax=Photobacterium carnosum TaxID=2023717 RepID=A0A2N4UY13_9GAMM|nr:BolA/IbaG family iron-sulfur metabolism protein [Photobacterium carnosum]KAE8176607.1 BolA family transcriptional regulator [Photobacterium carnosum]MBY3787337.1 BolA/IbaG family iron-sulfur metabolism protein [Photobacterium carnosum]MCD9493566.1 BolA/IbaG family iron-sulfur metabolism protein [Photobacterium carnosum]MCD9499117.1 BolA/IbaG family iron-sulfur metabolism protein [Photobacterium carnosum]MCD9513587.1 BolA/IbaG family iron-sulfur metabolism protein [Photobacterium carnosum]